ncbi:MAG: ribonuclease Y [Planctomycetota bacterium]|nr:ribonuclease Y [Planctomycetota bacterium]MDA1165440.1 ribonuclease Y [Planctomycetota bacterium]
MQDIIIGAGIGLVVGVAGFFFERIRRGSSYQDRDQILEQARRDAETLKRDEELKAREELLKKREEMEASLNTTRDGLHQRERDLDKREGSLDDRDEEFIKREKMIEGQQQKLTTRSKAMEVKEKELDRLLAEEQDKLFHISSLTPEQAKDLLLDRLDRQLKDETGGLIIKYENELKIRQEELSREILGMAIQRIASAQTSEMTVSTVDIPNDEMKGRIIGREGRNIRAFEKIAGVDVIVDDTPGVVVVSAFDKVRREIARLSLIKLIEDGRIHPTRIEEVVAETEKEMDAHIRKLGIEACLEANVVGLHEKLVYLMGRLQFRTSYSQNVLRHSIEVSHITGLLCEQVGLDAVMGRRCGFLHDIGKAADHEMEGGHPAVGAELLKRYNEGEEVVHAAAGHHDDIRPEFIYTVLVAAADAASASRPGARRENLERYVKRLEDLEAIACGFPGVNHAFAVQAGREIRIIVDSNRINDRESAKLAKECAKAIEENLTYPGEVKVVVLRETKAVEHAR